MRLLEKFSERKNAGAGGKKCAAAGDRAPDRFAGRIARNNCTNRSRRPLRTHGLTLDPRAQLRRTRLEIIDGIKSLLREIEAGHIDRAMIDVEMFSKHLYTRYYPDPDLLIRTSGEMRISNFLLWQLSYTEMYVTPKLWPDFTRKDFFAAVEDFAKRQRRYGGV